MEVFQREAAIAVFEDLHWADEATLDVLRFVGRRIGQTSVLLVLTYRDDELAPRHPLRTLLGDLASSPKAQRLALPPLSAGAVQAMVGDRNMDAVALHEQTAGNPFYITEVLANPDSKIPSSVRDAVLARAARLSSSGHAVLEAAAVIGQRIEPWLLEQVTGAEDPAVEESLGLGMLLPQDDVLVFRHELARETILDVVSPLRRRALHGLILNSLKAVAGKGRDLARLAHHAEAAGDRQAVLEYAPPAARQASAASDHRTAAKLYRLVMDYAMDLPPTERALLYEEYARESKLIDEEEAAVASRRMAIKLWQQIGNPQKQGENLAHLAIAISGSDRRQSEQMSQAAIELLEKHTPGRELALAYRTRALLHLLNQNFTEAIALAEKAVALAERGDDPLVLAMAYDTLGSAGLFLDYERGREALLHGQEISTRSGLDARVATVYSNLGSTSCELYRFREAERYLAEGIAYSADRDFDLIHWYQLAWQALTRLYLGRWEEAERAAARVVGRTDISTYNRFPAMLVFSRLRTRRGGNDPHPLLNEALEFAKRSGYLQHHAPVRAARAEAAWWAGDHALAAEEAGATYERSVRKRQPWYTGELAFWLWKAGETVELPDWVAEPYARQISGDWRAAAEEWERLGCPYEQAIALADGNNAAQVAALEIFERLGARPAAEASRHRLLAAGARNIPRRPRQSTRQNPFGLTNRQLEILTLLTENLTNAEIAGRLHISPKTVDHHVSAILAKLEVGSRNQAALLARQDPHFNPDK
jgi:DNA-binding CsgD family transcriptional regulator